VVVIKTNNHIHLNLILMLTCLHVFVFAKIFKGLHLIHKCMCAMSGNTYSSLIYLYLYSFVNAILECNAISLQDLPFQTATTGSTCISWLMSQRIEVCGRFYYIMRLSMPFTSLFPFINIVYGFY